MPPVTPVDVVVVTYNPGETIVGFLDSIAPAGGAASVTVVDNASRDDGPARAAASARAAFIQTGRNAGYGAAANIGAAPGEAPWILVSNADIVLGEGALAALVTHGEAERAIGAVGPLVRELDGSVYPSARPLPGLVLGAGHALFGRVWPGNPWTRRYRPRLETGGANRDVGWLSGACLLVRRVAWEGIGGFDEGFFMFFEDVDLGRRLSRAGWRNVWTSAAEVTHVGGHTWRSDPSPMLTAHHDAAQRYVSLIYPHRWQAPLRAAVARGLKSRLRREVAAAGRLSRI
jgi:N-acetylglucosaminyl-diphospho-decaprenol L-rhamnosyltransferase